MSPWSVEGCISMDIGTVKNSGRREHMPFGSLTNGGSGLFKVFYFYIVSMIEICISNICPFVFQGMWRVSKKG